MPIPLTQTMMRQAAGLGPDWDVIWMDRNGVEDVLHVCGTLEGRTTDPSEWTRVEYVPAPTPGIEVARCSRCRLAWVRAAVPPHSC